MDHLFHESFYKDYDVAKQFKLSKVLRDNIDHLQLKEIQLDACLGTTSNTTLGVVIHKNLNHMLSHLAKLSKYSPPVNQRRV